MLHTFLSAIQALPTDKPLIKEDVLTESFLIEKDNETQIYYAPHNEYINNTAKIVIAGITPGWHQTKTAFEQFVKSCASGETLEDCLKESKRAAGFAGSMRKNLINMLDGCGIPEIIDLPDASYLFGENYNLLHTTSIIKYPVFIHGKNYTGHQPSISQSPLLQHYAYKEFPNELASIQGNVLVIPLGKTVEKVIFKLEEDGKLPNHTYLTGVPHPSGANGHRVKQFRLRKRQLQEEVKRWVSNF
jgi:hypothetical protein